jgi:hypothetical protein
VDGLANWVNLDALAAALVGAIDDADYKVNEDSFVSNAEGNKFTVKNSASSGIDDIGEEIGSHFILQKIQWRWAYDDLEQDGNNYAIKSDNQTDTALGRASAESGDRTSYGIKITVTATQIAPAETAPPEP